MKKRLLFSVLVCVFVLLFVSCSSKKEDFDSIVDNLIGSDFSIKVFDSDEKLDLSEYFSEKYKIDYSVKKCLEAYSDKYGNVYVFEVECSDKALSALYSGEADFYKTHEKSGNILIFGDDDALKIATGESPNPESELMRLQVIKKKLEKKSYSTDLVLKQSRLDEKAAEIKDEYGITVSFNGFIESESKTDGITVFEVSNEEDAKLLYRLFDEKKEENEVVSLFGRFIFKGSEKAVNIAKRN